MPRGTIAKRSGRRLGSGSVTVIQGPLYAENQVRPTVYQQVAPGGVFATVLTLNITTTVGTFLDIEADLSALTDGSAGSTEAEAAIRILVDGVSGGLGSSETLLNDNANLEPFVALSLSPRIRIGPGPHVVELQWMIQGDGAGDKLIGFLVADQDGCSMHVWEVLA